MVYFTKQINKRENDTNYLFQMMKNMFVIE